MSKPRLNALHHTHHYAVCDDDGCTWTHDSPRAHIRAQQHTQETGHPTRYHRHKDIAITKKDPRG